MPRGAPPVVCAVSLLFLGVYAGTDEWRIGGEIKECVSSHLDAFMTNFSTGSATCPYDCANCLTDPMNCLVVCTNRAAACGCATAIPKAISTITTCCDQLWDVFHNACVNGMEGLGETVVRQITHICEATEKDLDGRIEGGPGSLLVKAKTAIEDGSLALLSGLEAAARHHPGAGALLELQPREPVAAVQVGDGYVAAHSKGSACLGMLEDVEGEHAAAAEGEDALPDLRVAAAQISERAVELLGREMPALEDKVHKAMVVGWSEDGPGMDSHDICAVILRHHDSL